jgi:hypothetical protein
LDDDEEEGESALESDFEPAFESDFESELADALDEDSFDESEPAGAFFLP